MNTLLTNLLAATVIASWLGIANASIQLISYYHQNRIACWTLSYNIHVTTIILRKSVNCWASRTAPNYLSAMAWWSVLILLSMLAIHCKNHPWDWEEQNSSIHASIEMKIHPLNSIHHLTKAAAYGSNQIKQTRLPRKLPWELPPPENCCIFKTIILTNLYLVYTEWCVVHTRTILWYIKLKFVCESFQYIVCANTKKYCTATM